MVYKWSIFKQSCLLCDEPSGEHAICLPCEGDLPWLGDQCAICAVPLPTSGLPCGACLRRRPSFDRVEAPLRYAFPVDALIQRFKHQAKWPIGRVLAEGLAAHLAHAYAEGLPRPGVLLPVPLSTRRLRQRGFNQARMLADWLSRPLAVATHADWLLRTQDTTAQQQLDAAARRRNLRRAFAVSDAARIAGRHVALVDDVLTTGATAEALARLIKRAGAARVDLYCLARTPRPGD
ncbi:ComF family protein [Stutzerimonas urumqiensis]|uniref:ComF family protein n=1 Tax=Stutzerimonas urumqiensis TaxID=638269 RepID=UPI003DA654EF